MIDIVTYTNNLRIGISWSVEMRKLNFGAGPGSLPESVLKQFAVDLLNFNGSGVGIGELSHRTELFERGVLEVANTNLSKLTGYGSEEWRVLWMTGGGTGQFAAVPLNFSFAEGKRAVYLVTGTWSAKAAEEAQRLVGPDRIVTIDLRSKVVNRESNHGIKNLNLDEFPTEGINYVYYCDNETVDGIELPSPNYFQDMLEDRLTGMETVFVVDASSNFLSRPLPKSNGRTSLVFAGVQKNLGAAGVTVVLIKTSLLQHAISPHQCPSVLDYKLMAKNNSLLNTPPVMAIHLCNLVLKELIKDFRDLGELDEFSKQKSGLIYGAVRESDKFYCPVETKFQSRMNVVFKSKAGEEDEQKFLEKAEKAGMIQLKGHRSVGGLRASLYNAVNLESVKKLALLIKSESESY